MQVNKAAPAFTTAASAAKSIPAPPSGAEAYRSDWQPQRAAQVLSSAPSASRTSVADGADPFRSNAGNDRGLAERALAPAGRSSDLGAQPRHLAPALTPITPVGAAQALRLASNDAPDPNQVHRNALLAQDVYRDTPNPPAGYRAASDADLTRLGLDRAMLEQPGESSFRARVYVSGEADQERYTVAFRGSQAGDDWKSNAQQGFGLDSTHYANALEIGKKLARSDADVTLVGHSLGGGLAAEAAIACGRSADTFNAAGLHGRTIEKAQAVAEANGRGVGAVNNYRVPGEVLTMLQEGGDRVIGAGLGALISGAGAVVGGAVTDLPEAYGTQHSLPNVAPSGTSWLETINPIDRHSMDWVLAGTAAQAGR